MTPHTPERRVLTPEQVKVHRDFWEGSDTAVTPDEDMVALCDSHEALRAERDEARAQAALTESRARCERLEAALRPFAEYAPKLDGRYGRECVLPAGLKIGQPGPCVLVSEFRAAHTALEVRSTDVSGETTAQKGGGDE